MKPTSAVARCIVSVITLLAISAAEAYECPAKLPQYDSCRGRWFWAG